MQTNGEEESNPSLFFDFRAEGPLVTSIFQLPDNIDKTIRRV